MHFVVLLVALLLAACQPLPHPFASDRPAPNAPELTPPDSAGIVVEAIAGAPEPAAHDLASAMAKALRDEDVPASTGARNRGSYRLSGTATVRDAGSGSLAVTLAWEMRDAGGAVISRQTASVTLPDTIWHKGGAGLAELAGQSAGTLARLVQSNAPPPLVAGDPLIAVRTVTGAPGDGGESLARAMADALRRAKLALAETPSDQPSFVLQGRVEISKPAAGRQQIKISWTLQRPDGGQVGKVEQENAIPAGSLDGRWGLTAYDVANAAAPGIAALITESKRTAPKS